MGINNVIIKFGNSPNNELVLYLRVNDKKREEYFCFGDTVLLCGKKTCLMQIEASFFSLIRTIMAGLIFNVWERCVATYFILNCDKNMSVL